MPRPAFQNNEKKTFIRFLMLIALTAIIGVLCFFPIQAERLPVKTYTIADGLLRDAVYKIKQDSRGFLWFCTVEGVSRFDGLGFINFTCRKLKSGKQRKGRKSVFAPP